MKQATKQPSKQASIPQSQMTVMGLSKETLAKRQHQFPLGILLGKCLTGTRRGRSGK